MWKGLSMGGKNTTLALPEKNLCIDCGSQIPELWKADNLFITHTHADHMSCILWGLHMRNANKLGPWNIWCHPYEEVKLKALLSAFNDIVDKGYGRLPYRIETLYPGEKVMLNKQTEVRAFLSIHSTICNGYVVGETRKKLRLDLKDVTIKELIGLKVKGVEVTEEIFVPLDAYCGDTSPKTYWDNPWLWEVPNLAIEITSLDDPDDRMHDYGHCNLKDIMSMPWNNKDITIMHVSGKFKDEEITTTRNQLTMLFPKTNWHILER